MKSNSIKTNLILLALFIIPFSASTQYEHEVNQTNSQTDTESVSDIDSIYFDLSTSEMHIRLMNGSLVSYPWTDLVNMTFSGSSIGLVSSIDCNNANVTGQIIEDEPVSGVDLEVPYAGGNGGAHSGQTVNSTGVTGLTATLPSGNFDVGAGTLVYELSGTPSSTGTASFLLNIGGESCTAEITVDELVGEIDNLDCAGATVTGTLMENVAASNVSFDVDYTNGNGGAHNGQSVASTGVTGLTATLTAGNFNTGAGTLTYEVTGTPNSDGTAEFLLDIGGEGCTVEINVDSHTGEIDNLDCANATVTGTLMEDVAANNVSFDVDYTNGNGGPHNGQSVSSTGVTGLTATLLAGNFDTGAGTLTYEVTGTPDSDGTAEFLLNIGGETCTVEITVDEFSGLIDNLDCAGVTITGSLEENVAASNVSFDVDYTGGNGGPHSGQTVNSTGVTGLTATLTAGNFNSGTGTLTYDITGTPNSSGTASFLLEIGGESCTIEIVVSGAGCPTLAIGDQHGGGIVIDNNYPGAPCGYLIVREDNDHNDFEFNTYDPCLEPETNLPTDIGEGQNNSDHLISICSTTPAHVCDTVTHGGQTDWFLPSGDEIEVLFTNWNGNNYPAGEEFYSSTLTYVTILWGTQTIKTVEPGVDFTNLSGNSLEQPVRCVRSF